MYTRVRVIILFIQFLYDFLKLIIMYDLHKYKAEQRKNNKLFIVIVLTIMWCDAFKRAIFFLNFIDFDEFSIF